MKGTYLVTEEVPFAVSGRSERIRSAAVGEKRLLGHSPLDVGTAPALSEADLREAYRDTGPLVGFSEIRTRWGKPPPENRCC